MEKICGDSVPSGIAVITPDNRIVDANKLLTAWAGVDLPDLIGRSIDDIVVTLERTGPLEPDFLAGLKEIRHDNGTARPVFTAEGPVASNGHRLVVVFDATWQRDLRENLSTRHARVERTRRRLELVIAASISFADATSESELAVILAATTTQVYAAEESVVFLLDEDGVFRQVAGTNPLVGVGDADILTERAMLLRSVMTISGVPEAHKVAAAIGEAFEGSGVQSVLIAPIRQGSTPLGIVAAFFHHPRQFDNEAAPLAEALAGQAARAVFALRLQHTLEHAAMHDETTGLPNRRLLENSLERTRRGTSTVLGVLFLDLDGFKNVNDTLGHNVGDDVLREVAARLRATVRDEDVVARYGGDEFVILCDLVSEAAGFEMAERVRECLCRPYPGVPDGIRVSASIGFSVTSNNAEPVVTDGLLRDADRAMYLAKNAGGNQVASATR